MPKITIENLSGLQDYMTFKACVSPSIVNDNRKRPDVGTVSDKCGSPFHMKYHACAHKTTPKHNESEVARFKIFFFSKSDVVA